MDPPRPYRHPVLWLATGMGLGWSPVAPGTVGALLGVALSLVLYHLLAGPWLWCGLAGLSILGVPICGGAARRLGGADPAAVIWDEIATVPWVFVLLPPESLARPAILLGGFLLHRLFDISKPPPVHWLERLPGGWGIMADDCAAAAYAALSLCGLHALWQRM